MPLNKFIFIGTLLDTPKVDDRNRQLASTNTKVKIKVKDIETGAHSLSSILHILCYDNTADYCLRHITSNDLLYIEGFIKSVTDWQNEPQMQLIAKFVKKISYENSKIKETIGNEKKFQTLAHRID